MTMPIAPSVQSPRAYDLINLSGLQVSARLAAATSAVMRANLRAASQDLGYLFKIHPTEAAQGLTEADLRFGLEVGSPGRYGPNTTPGTTDMTVPIQRALNTGLRVKIPNEDHLITAALHVTTSHQLIIGEGKLSRIVTATDIESIYTDTSVFGVTIDSIEFHNSVSEAVTGPTHFQVHFGSAASGCKVLNCDFTTALTGTVVRTTHHAGLWLGGGNLHVVNDCRFQQAHILIESTDTTVSGGFVYSFGFQYAIKITSAGEVILFAIRGILGGQDKGCVWIPSASYMNKILGCYFGGTYSGINIGKGILADQQQMMKIIGNTFHEMDDIGVHLTTPTSGNLIAHNVFWAGHPKQNDATGLIEGNPDIYLESLAYAGSGTIVTDNICNRFVGPVEDGMPGIGKSYAIKVNTYSGTANNYIGENSISGARYLAPAIQDDNAGDVITNNPGSPVWRSWTPTDLSGASLTFTSVNCKYIRDVESVTVYGEFTYPTTANGSGATIGGLPVAASATLPIPGTLMQTNATNAQKIKLSAGNAYFFLTDSVDAAQTNAACSAKYFKFCIRYPV